MSRLYVPPLPEATLPEPQADPLLEKFRQDTIKGKKVEGRPRNSTEHVAGADFSSTLLDIELAIDQADCNIDFDCGS